MKQDPPLDTKCRDKFLVQSVSIPSDREHVDVHTIVRTSEIDGRPLQANRHVSGIL